MKKQVYSVNLNMNQAAIFQAEKPLLSHLDVELTERCQNACIHCCINLNKDDRHALQCELTTAQWKEILRQAAELGALSVRFTGGEPLLRTDFAELYLFTRRLGLQVMIFTNGRLITPELAGLFARIPPLLKIEISVYGMHQQMYDEVTCSPGAYHQYMRGISLLLEYKVPFVVKYALLPKNQEELPEFEQWAATLPAKQNDPVEPLLLDLRSRRDSEAKNRLIASLRFSPEENIALIARHAESYKKSMAQFCASFLGLQGDRLFACGAGANGCVDAYGKYQMCMMLRHPDTVYNLKNGSLQDALTRVFPRIGEMKAANKDYLHRCARCFLKGLCVQCPAKSWAEHGTLDTPVEYFCSIAHAQARYLGLLKEDEKAWEVTEWKECVSILSAKEAIG